MKLALLNTSIVTTDGTFTLSTISLEKAKSLVSHESNLDSAIGHQSTADAMSELLGVNIPVNRQLFIQDVGQTALVFKLNGRPKEGQILTRQDLEEIGYSWKTLTRIS